MTKGNVEKRGKNSYRLSYVYNSKLYRETITASNMKEARKELKKWIEKIEKKIVHRKNTLLENFPKHGYRSRLYQIQKLKGLQINTETF